MSDIFGAKWRGRRGDYGNTNRWLINKDASGSGWLLHEPIRDDSSPALQLPTFEAAVAAFVAFSRRVPPTTEGRAMVDPDQELAARQILRAYIDDEKLVRKAYGELLSVLELREEDEK